MTFKDDLYSRYLSTHLRHRKGDPSLEDFKRRAADYRRRLKRLLPSDESIRLIDVGCGSGHLVWWLQNEGYTNAEGIDLSPELIEAAVRLGVRNVKVADLRVYLNEEAKLGKYQAIVLRDVLEHFHRDEILSILELCLGCLSPGGILLLQVPNAESPFFGRIRYGDFTHEVAFTTTSMAQVLDAVGLGNPRFFPVGPLPGLRPKQLARYLVWKCVEGLYKFLLLAELGRGSRIVTQDILAVAAKQIGTLRDGRGQLQE